MRTPHALLLLLGTPSCIFAPNPAFGLDTVDTVDTADTGDSPTPTTTGLTPTSSTSAAATTSTDVTLTDAPTSSDVDTFQSITTSSSPITLPSETTGDVETSDTDTDATGAPATCWEQGASNWPVDGEPPMVEAAAQDLFIAPDALTLLHLAGQPHRLLRSIRPDPFSPFPPAVQIVSWQPSPIDPRHARLDLGGEELLLSVDGDIHFSKHVPSDLDEYTVPMPLVGVNTGDIESHPTATDDGRVLIVQRDDGPAIGSLPRSWQFHQFVRDAPEPGGAFLVDGPVTPVVAPLGLALCPALSPDGLHLFFASTDAEDLPPDAAETSLSVFYTSRPNVDQAWDVPEKIAGLNGGKGLTCPTSVSADGCTLAYTRAAFSRPLSATLLLASRAP